MDSPHLDDDYEYVAWYHVTEVERLFEALEAAAVRFHFETADQVQTQNAIAAAYGGGFGQGAQVLVSVHRDDAARFHEVHRDVFEPQREMGNDWRKKLRER